jgi:hypothetical protein
MGSQQDIDAATAAMTTAAAKLNTAEPLIAAEIGGGVSTTALNAAVGPLVAAVNGITALATPPADVITVASPGDQTSSIAAGPVSLQVTATDSATGEVPSFAAAGLPSGLSIDAAGLITGTPTVTGVSAVVVTATDSTGAVGTASFGWTVTA